MTPSGVPHRVDGRRSWPARLAGAASVGGRLGVEAARLGYDRLSRSGPIPATIGELDAGRLGLVLGRRVACVEVLDATTGTTDRARLAVTGDGLPPSVFVKMAPGPAVTRLFGNLADLGATEVGFYRDLRPGLDVEAPAVVGLAHDARTGRFVIVLEDLAARGCRFGDVLDALDLSAVSAALETLAGLHAAHWQAGGRGPDRRAARPGWLRANGSDPLLPLVTTVVRRCAPRLARADPSVVPAAGRAIIAEYPAVARALDAGPHTVLHGDPHPGNWYFDGERAGLLDWQAVRRGNPLRDVAYLLVLALDPATRRQHERALLRRYGEALAARGGPAYDAATTWETYRAMAAYAYVAATFTAGLGGLQSDDTARAGLQRAATAIRDLDTSAALGLSSTRPARRRGASGADT